MLQDGRKFRIEWSSCFVLNKFEKLSTFRGDFIGCKLKDGDDNTYCKYSCSCDQDNGHDMHIRAFKSDDNDMSIFY